MLLSITFLIASAESHYFHTDGVAHHHDLASVSGPTWSSWTSWGNCVGGQKIRTCNCLSNDSNICQGVLTEKQICSGQIWSSWTAWGECVGNKRTRTCDCISPDTYHCRGVLSESKDCLTIVTLPPPTTPGAIWSSWSSWGNCAAGKRSRTCNCISSNSNICQGVLEEKQDCAEEIIWSSWTSFGDCVRGKRVRTCDCLSGNPSVCRGVLSEAQTCTPAATPQCSTMAMYSLNACLNFQPLCFSWWNVNHLRQAQSCFTTWRYSPAYINRFNNLFGNFMRTQG